jgi:predicted nucleotidyltransferase
MPAARYATEWTREVVAVAEAVNRQAAGPSLAELVGLREEILALAARHGASNVRVFGSVARGDADAASDVDFLVDFEDGRSLLDLACLLVDLEDLLGLRVDVVTEPGLKARIRQRVLAEAVAV